LSLFLSFSKTRITGLPIHLNRQVPSMQTLKEMRSLHLITAEQHVEIAAWIRENGSPEGILAMPPHLWRAFELASVLMGVDNDLTQPPLLSADGVAEAQPSGN